MNAAEYHLLPGGPPLPELNPVDERALEKYAIALLRRARSVLYSQPYREGLYAGAEDNGIDRKTERDWQQQLMPSGRAIYRSKLDWPASQTLPILTIGMELRIGYRYELRRELR